MRPPVAQGPPITSRPPPQYTPPTHPSQRPPSQKQPPLVSQESLNQDHIDSKFSTDIGEVAEKFAEEIEALKEGMCEVFGHSEEGASKGQSEVKGLGGLSDLSRINEEVTRVKSDISKAAQEFKVGTGQC